MIVYGEIALLVVCAIVVAISFRIIFDLVRISQVLMVAVCLTLAVSRAACTQTKGDVTECIESFDSTFLGPGLALYQTATRKIHQRVYATPTTTTDKDESPIGTKRTWLG